MGFDGLVVVSDPYLQRRFTQAELRALQAQYAALRDSSPSGRMRLRDLPAALSSLGGKGGAAGGDAGKENSAPGTPGLTDEEWASVLKAVARADDRPHQDVNFELFLRVYAEMQLRLKDAGGGGGKKAGGIARSSSSSAAAFLTAATTTLLHTISESEKASYVGHINAYLAEDPFLKNALVTALRLLSGRTANG